MADPMSALAAGLGITISTGLGGVFTANISHASLVALLGSPAGQILLICLGIVIVILAVAVLVYATGCLIGKLKGNDK